MILRRLGNKAKIAKEIQKYFPPHKIYIEPFFGAGGMFFNKPKAKYNFLNDIDSDVFNLFMTITNTPKDLIQYFKSMPVDENLWNYWKKNKETDPVKKATRFLLLSNFGYMGKPDTLHMIDRTSKKSCLSSLEKGVEFLQDCTTKFSSKDFRDFIKSIIPIRSKKDDCFIYCDPPYLGTGDNYSNSFTEQDSRELFETLISTGCKFAVSEFDNPIILDLAKEHNLEVITIGERQNLKNRRTEILIINYPNPNWNLFN